MRRLLLVPKTGAAHVTNCTLDQTNAFYLFVCLLLVCSFSPRVHSIPRGPRIIYIFHNAAIFPDLQTRCTTQASVNSRRTPTQSVGVLPSTVFRDSKRRRKNASSFAGAENRTRTGTDVTPRDFKSLASAYSATSASLEASPGIEPGMKALQASALPLGYDAIRKRAFDKTFVILTLERETGFGPATSTLARWHSTTESLPQVGRFAPSFSATTIIYQIN